MYIVEKRYEHWTKEGKVWTDWFRRAVFETKNEATESMKSSKELCKSIAKSTKLKHEFNVREMTQEEFEEYTKPRSVKKKGKKQ